MWSRSKFFQIFFDVDVHETLADIQADVGVSFRDKEDEPVDVSTPIVLQTIAIGLFMIWKRYGYTLSDMSPNFFLKSFNELLEEVFETKLKELEIRSEGSEGGEIVNLDKHRLRDEGDGED
jgi:hypothetical protein